MNDFNIAKSTVNITVHEAASSLTDKLTLKGYIVVIDDDSMMATLNSLMLERFVGVRTLKFTNPCEAMAHILSHKTMVAGIVTDLFMYTHECGIHTGLELADRLRDLKINPPILFSTGLSGGVEVTLMKEYGYFAEKPLTKHLQAYAQDAANSEPLFLFFEQVAAYDRANCK